MSSVPAPVSVVHSLAYLTQPIALEMLDHDYPAQKPTSAGSTGSMCDGEPHAWHTTVWQEMLFGVVPFPSNPFQTMIIHHFPVEPQRSGLLEETGF